MITYQILAGTVDVSVVIRIIDSTDGTPETGVVWNTSGIDLEYRRELAASTDITEASLAALTTAHTDGGFLHIGNGYYRLDLPDAACAAGVAGCLVHGTVTGMVVIGCYINLTPVPADLRQLLGTAMATPTVAGVPEVDVTHWIGTAAATPTVAGVPEVDLTHVAGATTDVSALATNVAAILVDTGTTLDGRIPAALVSGRIDASVGAMAAGVVTAAAVATGAIDADALAADAVAEIADGVWDEDATGHQTLGTFGQAIGDPVADANTIFKAVVTDAAGATVGVDVVAVKADTATIGAAGAGLTAVPWNAAWDAEVESEVNDALVVQRLDELLNADSDIDGAAPPTVGSVVHELMSKTAGSFTYDQATDSLEAIRDKETDIETDTAEIGAAGSGLTNINLPDQTMNITGNITGNLSGSVGSVTADVGITQAGADKVWSSATRTLTAFSTALALAVWDVLESAIATANSIGVKVKTNLDAAVSTRSTVTTAQVNAEVVDALATDTYAEPGQGTPAATTTLAAKLNYLYKAWRNRSTQTASQHSLYGDDATTIDQKATFSDDGTTADRGEVVTGP